MSDATPPLLDEDYDSAREFLEDTCRKGSQDAPRKQLQFLARQHARLGRRAFRVLHELDPPRHEFDRILQRFDRGLIDQKECEKLCEQAEWQSVQLETLNALIVELQDRLHWYGRLLQLALECDQSDHEKQRKLRAERFLFEISRVSSLPRRQIQQIEEFLEEARVEQGWDVATLGDQSASTAIALIMGITDLTAKKWKSCENTAFNSQTKSEYLYATTAAHLFRSTWMESTPTPADLHALLRQEHALGRSLLRKSGNASFDTPAIINEVNVSTNVYPERANEQTQANPATQTKQSHSARDGKSAADGPMNSTDRPANKPKLGNWAVGMEHKGKWWLFHRQKKQWHQRTSIPVSSGNVESLMDVLAAQEGFMEKSDAIGALKHKYPGADKNKFDTVITETLKKARKAIRVAIAESAKCPLKDVDDPIPNCRPDWRAKIEIGYAIENDHNKLTFKLKSEM